jgi:hypothetical protein
MESEIREFEDDRVPHEGPTVDLVVQTARCVAEEEFNRAERLDRKALNLATVIGAFFSLSQIVVVNVISEVADSKYDDLRRFAIAAVALSAISVACSLLVFLPRRERSFPVEKLSALLEGAKRDNPVVVANIVKTYRLNAEDRRAANRWRARFYLLATLVGAFAVIATAAELAIAMYAITQS